MTAAVCLKCGKMKMGAWTPCHSCGHRPSEPDDMAKAILATDHYLSRQDLKTISRRIRNHEPVAFDPEQVTEMVASIQSERPLVPGHSESRPSKQACVIVAGLIIAVLAGIILFFMAVLPSH